MLVTVIIIREGFIEEKILKWRDVENNTVNKINEWVSEKQNC